MCGNVGMAGEITKDYKSLFDCMLIVDQIRGPHSTGIASADQRGDVNVFKRATTPVDLMSMRGYEKAIHWDPQVLIGHNRYATVGKINNYTAHPFEFEKIVGTHNGTLQHWTELPESRDFDVDSECLLHNIDKHGWEKTAKYMYGAWALVVYDAVDHKLQVLRNAERPLHMAYTEDRKVLLWASEAWMIKGLAPRFGIKVGKVFQPKENVLLTWDLPRIRAGSTMPDAKSTKIVFPEKKPLPAYPVYQGPATVTTGKAGTPSRTGDSSSTRGRTIYSQLPSILGVDVDEEVIFAACEKKFNPMNQSPYLKAVLAQDPWSEVRIYTSEQRIDEMVLQGGPWEGKVRNLIPEGVYAGVRSDAYLVIQYDSISYLGDEEDTTYYPGPNDTMVTAREYDELTKYGCAYCTADIADDELIGWVGNSPICSSCLTEEEKRA